VWGLLVLFLATGVVLYQGRGQVFPALVDVIARASGAEVAHILVEGATYSTREDLAQALSLQRGDPLVGFSTLMARKRLEALPWVRLAAVERRLPNTVRVEIYEHTPLARVQEGETDWVINKDGDKIVPATDRFADLPLLAGAGAGGEAARLFALLQERHNLLNLLTRATWVGERRWDLTFKSGVTVQLPEKEAQRALAWLSRLDETRHVLTLAGGEVDLRLPDRITLRIPETAEAGAVLGGPV
jgi:cell division protein FtsQ